MTDTIDHQQAAVKAVSDYWHKMQDGEDHGEHCDWYEEDAKGVITAAAPHLRAAWEREMVEKIRAKFLGPDFGRNPVNGQDSPDAALHAAYDEGLQTALALLEGGGGMSDCPRCGTVRLLPAMPTIDGKPVQMCSVCHRIDLKETWDERRDFAA